MPPAVLFDLDGTLTDSKPGITRCIAHALERMGRTPPDVDSLTWCVGPPLARSFPILLECEDPEAVAQAIAFYRERFSTVGLFENAVFDGIPEALASLKEGGYRLFVATSKPAVFAERIIAHFGLAPFFERVYGSELDGTRDDKAELIAHLLRSESLDASETLMIGDREHDVIGASRNGVRCIGVEYGFAHDGELTRAGAVALCATPAEIPGAVRGLLDA